jgi:glutathione S-transferase
MKLYSSIGPNPRMVRMFMAEKDITIDTQDVDIRGGENRREPYVSEVNPRGQCPALKLDDGSVVTEVTAICEYLEDRFPDPPLIGRTAEEKAATRMWTRRVDLGICEPAANGFRFAEGLKMFESRMRCLPEAAAGLKAIAQDNLGWLDGQLADRDFLAGDRISMADILLFSFLDFAQQVGQKIAPEHANVAAWYARMKARPSAAA